MQQQFLPPVTPIQQPVASSGGSTAPGAGSPGGTGGAQNLPGGGAPTVQAGVTGGGNTASAGAVPQPPALVQLTPEQAAEEALKRALRFIGWYPRWWILSATFCALLIGIWSLFTTIVCGANTASKSSFCQMNTWTDWRQAVVVAVVWIIFLLGWLAAFALGVGPIEIRRSHSPTVLFFTSISEYRPIYFFLYMLGVFALGCTIIFWAVNRLQPLTFALYSIVIFVANSCFLYYRQPAERRAWIIGYGLFAAICMLIMFLWPLLFQGSRFQPMIFLTEIVIIGIVIVLLIQSVGAGLKKNKGQGIQGAQGGQSGQSGLPPEEALVQGLEDSTRPGAVLMALVRKLTSRNSSPPPAQPTQTQPQPPAQPTLQTYSVTPPQAPMQAPGMGAQGGMAQGGQTQGGMAQSVASVPAPASAAPGLSQTQPAAQQSGTPQPAGPDDPDDDPALAPTVPAAPQSGGTTQAANPDDDDDDDS